MNKDKLELQSLPPRTELAKKLKESMAPKKGTIIMPIDYSSIELRILSQVLNMSDEL